MDNKDDLGQLLDEAGAAMSIAEKTNHLASWEKAAAILQKGIAINKNDFRLFLELSICQRGVGNLEEALLNINTAIGINPYSLAYTLRGAINTELGRFSEAESDLLYADELGGISSFHKDQNNVSLGHLYYLKGDYSQSIDYLTEGSDNTTCAIISAALLGDAYYQMRNPKKSEKAYQKAITLFSSVPSEERNMHDYRGAVRAERGLASLGVSTDHPIEKDVIAKGIFSKFDLDNYFGARFGISTDKKLELLLGDGQQRPPNEPPILNIASFIYRNDKQTPTDWDQS